MGCNNSKPTPASQTPLVGGQQAGAREVVRVDASATLQEPAPAPPAEPQKPVEEAPVTGAEEPPAEPQKPVEEAPATRAKEPEPPAPAPEPPREEVQVMIVPDSRQEEEPLLPPRTPAYVEKPAPCIDVRALLHTLLYTVVVLAITVVLAAAFLIPYLYLMPMPFSSACSEDEMALELGKEAGSDDAVCTVKARSMAVFFAAAATLLVVKLVSFESFQDFLDKVMGSTDQAKRGGFAGLLFRLSAIWSFYGVMVAVVRSVTDQRDKFSSHVLTAYKSDESYYLLLDTGMTAHDVADSGCQAFGDAEELRSFARFAFGYSEDLCFLVGAICLGLSELFKLDVTKRYIVSVVVSMEDFAFWTESLVQDGLLAQFDALITKCQKHVKDNAGNLLEIQKSIEGLSNMSAESLKGPADFAKRKAMEQMKPEIEKVLKAKKTGLTWDDVKPIIEQIDSVEELMAIGSDPGAFLEELKNKSGPAAKAAALNVIKQALKQTKWLKENGLEWDDIEDIVGEALQLPPPADPVGFIKDLANNSLPLVRKMVMKKLPDLLRPKLPAGITWESVQEPVKAYLESIADVEQLKEKLIDPELILKELAVPMAAAALKPKLQPLLPSGVEWDDVMEILLLVDTPEEMMRLATNPAGFITEVVVSSKDLAIKWGLARLKPLIQPEVKKLGLMWSDAMEALKMIDTVEEIEEAISDTATFLKNLEGKSIAIAVRWTVAKIRSKVEPEIKKAGIAWEDAVKAFQKADTLEELADAAANPLETIENLMGKAETAGESQEEEQIQRLQNMKAIWPNLFLVAGASLWITTHHVNIKPCVTYDDGTATKAFLGAYTFEDDYAFMQFVTYCHAAAFTAIWTLLWLTFLSGRLLHVNTQRRCAVAVALVMIAWSVALATYEKGGNDKTPKASDPAQMALKAFEAGKQAVAALLEYLKGLFTGHGGAPPKEAGAKLMTMFTGLGASFGAGMQKLWITLQGLPLGALMCIGGAADVAANVQAGRISKPTNEERTKYRVHRAERIAAKTAKLSVVAPPQCKAKAATLASTAKVQAKKQAGKKSDPFQVLNEKKKEAVKAAGKMSSRAEELLTAEPVDYNDPELIAIIDKLKAYRGNVKALCGAPWNEWSAPGECQVCKKKVDRKEKGLHCANGGHRICWVCMCKKMDWDKLSAQEMKEEYERKKNEPAESRIGKICPCCPCCRPAVA